MRVVEFRVWQEKKMFQITESIVYLFLMKNVHAIFEIDQYCK